MIIPLCSVLVRLDLGYCVQLWSPQFKNGVGRMESIQKRPKKMVKEPALWGKIKGVWSLIPGEEKAPGDLITIFQFLKGSYKEDGGSLHKEPHGEDKDHRV